MIVSRTKDTVRHCYLTFVELTKSEGTWVEQRGRDDLQWGNVPIKICLLPSTEEPKVNLMVRNIQLTLWLLNCNTPLTYIFEITQPHKRCYCSQRIF